MKEWNSALGNLMGMHAPKADFLDNFQGAERDQVVHIFKQLNLPLPKPGSFLAGTEGGILFHTDAGIVIRAERKDGRQTHFKKMLAEKFDLDFGILKSHMSSMIAERIDHDHILQPIVSLQTDNHVIEIVPGRKLGVTDEDVDKMQANLRKSGIAFWDGGRSDNNFILKMIEKKMQGMAGLGSFKINQGAENSAYLPIVTKEFPRGYPVIADRMAAGWVPLYHDKGSMVFKMFGRLASQPPKEGARLQKELYAPLREAFASAWPDAKSDAHPEKMKQFWDLCEEFTHREVTPGHMALEAGWVAREGQSGKSGQAASTAQRYRDQINNTGDRRIR